MLTSATRSHSVYSKEYDDGTLYALIHTKPQKKPSTLDKEISSLDSMLMKKNNTSSTHFKSISPLYNGKVLTFGAHDHIGDVYYNTIFNISESGAAIGRRHNIQPGVYQFEEKLQDHALQFDIVKKRKKIEAINDMVGADITQTLLGEETDHFFSFSDAVKGAFDTLETFETSIFEQETLWMQQDQQCKSNTRVGYAYAAFNTCLGDPVPIKMGATMKDSPYERLKELSRCLPQSFELLACVPSTDPFAVEKMVHAHFERFRIKKRSTGRSTEFFMVNKDEVCKFFADLNQELLLPA
jgi:hypothetical protein